MRLSRVALIALLSAATSALAGCAPGSPPPPAPYDAEAHRADVEEWRAWRDEQLRREDGWLALAGLYWLQPGDNDFGSDAGSALLYAADDAPARIGTFHVEDRVVRFEAGPGVDVSGEAGPIDTVVAYERIDGETLAPTLRWGPLRWFVMVRDERLAVRLRSSASPVLVHFGGMDNFALAREWRLHGRFEAYDPPRAIKIPNILGTIGDGESPGAAVFEVDGETYRLDLWRDSDDPDNLFTAFADRTNAVSTYGGGRFLWIDAPDEHGRIVVDFNKSYNPPCVFTPYATCPLPPTQNRLPLMIEAGERTFEPSSP